jgi:hypothetical protein
VSLRSILLSETYVKKVNTLQRYVRGARKGRDVSRELGDWMRSQTLRSQTLFTEPEITAVESWASKTKKLDRHANVSTTSAGVDTSGNISSSSAHSRQQYGQSSREQMQVGELQAELIRVKQELQGAEQTAERCMLQLRSEEETRRLAEAEASAFREALVSGGGGGGADKALGDGPAVGPSLAGRSSPSGWADSPIRTGSPKATRDGGGIQLSFHAGRSVVSFPTTPQRQAVSWGVGNSAAGASLSPRSYEESTYSQITSPPKSSEPPSLQPALPACSLWRNECFACVTRFTRGSPAHRHEMLPIVSSPFRGKNAVPSSLAHVLRKMIFLRGKQPDQSYGDGVSVTEGAVAHEREWKG